MSGRSSGSSPALRPVRFVRRAARRPPRRKGELGTTRSGQTRVQIAVRASARPGRSSGSRRCAPSGSWATRSKRFRHRLARAVQSPARGYECESSGRRRFPPAYIATNHVLMVARGENSAATLTESRDSLVVGSGQPIPGVQSKKPEFVEFRPIE
jgi:hypothetical protein